MLQCTVEYKYDERFNSLFLLVLCKPRNASKRPRAPARVCWSGAETTRTASGTTAGCPASRRCAATRSTARGTCWRTGRACAWTTECPWQVSAERAVFLRRGSAPPTASPSAPVLVLRTRPAALGRRPSRPPGCASRRRTARARGARGAGFSAARASRSLLWRGQRRWPGARKQPRACEGVLLLFGPRNRCCLLVLGPMMWVR